jgi:hypothetical protein
MPLPDEERASPQIDATANEADRPIVLANEDGFKFTGSVL